MKLLSNRPVVGRCQKVVWIHCNYTHARLAPCLDLAEKFLDNLGLLKGALLISVNNGLETKLSQRHQHWIQIKGTNRVREFSAWQEGWEVVETEAADVDLVILTNDTFPFHQPYYLLGILLRFVLRRVINAKVQGFALGVVERGFDSHILPEYITSFFMVFDRRAALSIMHRLTVVQPEMSIAMDASCGKIVLSPDGPYEAKINRWLLEPGKQSWYDAAPLTTDNYYSMAGKARSILHEHSLSVHLRSDGISLVSCFDFPFGFLARWVMRLDGRLRNIKASRKRVIFR